MTELQKTLITSLLEMPETHVGLTPVTGVKLSRL